MSHATSPTADVITKPATRAENLATSNHENNPAPKPTTPDRPDTALIADIVRRLNAGEISASELPATQRQQCVAMLTVEGFSVSEIAQLMRLSERTVVRDRAAARHDEAIAPARTLGDELLGEFQRLTLASVQRLTRLARDTEAPHYSRLWAEEAMVRIYQRFIDTAHRLSYFESGQRRLTHLRNADPAEQVNFEEQLKMLRRSLPKL